MNENIREGKIEKIVNGGFGLLRSEDGIVFLKYVAPGEKVKYRERERAKGIIWGDVVEIDEPHPGRVTPECRYYGDCGGCALSHLRYDLQMKIKEDILTDDLNRIGKLKINCQNIYTSPEYSYRVRAKLKGLENGKIGFVRKSTNDIMEINSCMIVVPEINDFIRKWNNADSMGFFHQIDVFYNNTEKRLYVHITGEPEPETIRKFSLFENTFFSWNGSDKDNSSELRIGDYNYMVSPDSFFQVNRFQWEDMLNIADSWMKSSDLSLDLYTGSGFFIPVLLKYSGKVIGIENSKRSVQLAEKSFLNAEFLRSPVEKYLFPSADLMIIDPPRSGIPDSVIQRIFQTGPDTVIYISCSSATLARDINKFIQNNYRIEETALLDLFPQTAHFETMTLLKHN
ncbi:MAG: hypothetical protein ABFR36_02510 [Acidobacteriota bacterium]